jgi:hypothetical protein
VLRRTANAALAVVAAAAIAALHAGTADANASNPPGTNAGPPYQFRTELMGDVPQTALKDQVELIKTKLGYRYWTGQQNNHIVVTLVDGGLKFRDTHTDRFKLLAAACHRQQAKVGISAVCRVPTDITVSHPLLVEIWPRLGNDYLNTSTLPATFAVTMLSDEGNDTAYFGAGPDFFNGHKGRDHVYGAAGNDWVRGGIGRDFVYGGSDHDDIVGMQGDDDVHGGDGDDRIWGAGGGDTVWGDAGSDSLVCGDGHDTATIDTADYYYGTCESVNQSS